MSHNTPPTPHQAINDDEIDLTQLGSTLWFYKWRILLMTILCGIGGIIFAFTSKPIYQADAMLEITGTKNQVLGELSDLIGGSQATPTDSEIELIKSRLIIGKSVNDLGLDLVITPNDSFIDDILPNNDAPAEITIGEFHIDALSLNQPFKLITLGEKEYQVITPNGQTYTGIVGKHLQLGHQNSRIIVNKISAPFGKQFTITRFTQLAAIERVRKNLSVAAKGKNVPILGLSMTGNDPIAIQNTLNRIIANYTEHNRNKDVQTATSGLKFINEELPVLEDKLRDAENQLNVYRSRSGSLDVPTEARGTLESLNKIEMQMVDLRTEKSALSEVYTSEHPAFKALEEKMKVLEQAKVRLNTSISKMPQTQQEIIRLTRDVEINQAIYVQLLNKRQELSILSASSQGNVRLIDSAMTAEKPIKPKKAIIVALASIFGLFVSAGFYLLKTLLKKGISSEEEISALGLDVLSTIPLSEVQYKRDTMFRKIRKNKNARANSLLVIQDPTDPSIEALRALRTNLHFRSMGQDNKVVLISGATPEVGKSFVSANLAVLMAQAGRKVLLIDGDMRKGYLHTLLGQPEKNTGFADMLQLNKLPKEFNEFIQKTAIDGLEFIGIGSNTPRNPSELLLNNHLSQFLAWANQHYDHVILDTPPVLVVTDAAVMGQYAGTALLISRFGQTDIRELDHCISRFAVNNVKIDGVILNGVERTAKNYYGYYDKYAKYGAKS